MKERARSNVRFTDILQRRRLHDRKGTRHSDPIVHLRAYQHPVRTVGRVKQRLAKMHQLRRRHNGTEVFVPGWRYVASRQSEIGFEKMFWGSTVLHQTMKPRILAQVDSYSVIYHSFSP